jgi:hypothetical protein
MLSLREAVQNLHSPCRLFHHMNQQVLGMGPLQRSTFRNKFPATLAQTIGINMSFRVVIQDMKYPPPYHWFGRWL